jgi:hypothetical protein
MRREEELLVATMERLFARPLSPCERRLSLMQAFLIGELSEAPTHEAHWAIMAQAGKPLGN